LQQHPQLKNEFDLFGKAKLEADNSISFPGKSKLYKKEKAGKVIPIMWRSLAAAVFIGFGLWIMQKYMSPKEVQQTVAVQVTPAKKVIAPQKITPSSLNKKDNEVAKIKTPGDKGSRNKNKSSRNENDIEPKTMLKEEKENKDLIATSLVKTSIKNKKLTAEKQVINFPEKKINNDVAISPTRINEIPRINAATNAGKSFVKDVEQKPLSDVTEQPAMQVHTASYVNDGSDKNENYVFYNITTEEFRKSKVGGFLKKVKRIVERNNPITHLFSGEDKQVASN
ncbi:MAG: hypothetical protein M3015_15000, partial [Bacteroidota bacterium]|nr:hypothetical protein [Bacteroidota bacterium]